MYMPGRLRTGSRPSRTWISSAPYFVVCAISVHSLPALGVRERLDRHGFGNHDEVRALDDLTALAAARADLLRIGLELELLAALLGLDAQHVALAAGHEADHHVVFGRLDHGDAAARTFELRDVLGLDVQHVAIARRAHDDV